MIMHNKAAYLSRILFLALFLFGLISPAQAGLLDLVGGGASTPRIDLVKNGILDFDKSITVGKALDNYRFFRSTAWKEFESDQGRNIVEFTGEFDLFALAEEGLNIPGMYGDGFGSPSLFDMRDREHMKLCLSNRENCILSVKNYTMTIQFIINLDDTFEIAYIGCSLDGNENAQDIANIQDIYNNKPVSAAVPAFILYRAGSVLLSAPEPAKTQEAETVPVSSAPSQKKFIKFSDELYETFMENEAFEIADRKLNSTWALLKKTLKGTELDSVRKKQSQWIAEGRDKAANGYLAQMSPVEAFTRATLDRVRELSSLISAAPSHQEYLYGAESHEGDMTIDTKNGVVSATISTFSHDGRGTCEFDGALVDTDNDGWYESENPEDGISILFMQNRAELLNFGNILCGAYGSMAGEYTARQ